MEIFLSWLTELNWQTIANVATAAALLIAAGAFIWQIISHGKEKAYTKSHFAFHSAVESYDRAVEVLSDGNNDRVTWISAARVIERANRISEKITEQVHKDFLEVHLERYRLRMAEILGYDNSNKGAAFFYGAESADVDVDTAAKNSSRPEQTAYGTKGALNYIPETTLATLYAIAGYPRDYEDPLKKESLQAKIGMEMRAGFPGLYDYLMHRAEYDTFNGRLVKRNGNGES